MPSMRLVGGLADAVAGNRSTGRWLPSLWREVMVDAAVGRQSPLVASSTHAIVPTRARMNRCRPELGP